MQQVNTTKINQQRKLRGDEPMVDPKLEWEADRVGKIHGRKNSGNTEFLPGYGTTNFGVSPFEEKKIPSFKELLPSSGLLTRGLFFASGIISSGYLLWLNKKRIVSGIEVLGMYALFLKESRAQD